MATFTTAPDYSAQLTQKPRVLTTQFGDGYQQRVARDLTPPAEQWTLTFSRRTPAEWDAVLDFLEARLGVEAFDWTSPIGTVGKWVCPEWTLSPETAAIGTVTARFVQVFDSTYAGPGGDLLPPTWSGTVTASSITTTTATISWPAATDAMGVAGYRYSLDGGSTWSSLIVGLSASLTGLTAGTAYTPQVRAYDASGNMAGPLTGSFTTSAGSLATGDVTLNFSASDATPAGTEYGIPVLALDAYSTVYGATLTNVGATYWVFSAPANPTVSSHFSGIGIPNPGTSPLGALGIEGELQVTGAGTASGATGWYTKVQFRHLTTGSGQFCTIYWKNSSGTEVASTPLNYVSSGGGVSWADTGEQTSSGYYVSRIEFVSPNEEGTYLDWLHLFH